MTDKNNTHWAPDRRRWISILTNRWPTVLGIAAGFLVMDGLEVGVELSVLTVLIAAIYLPIRAVCGQLRSPSMLVLETVGVLVFSALALTALIMDHQLAQYLLAAALFGHAA